MRWRFIGASMAAFLTVIIGLVCLVNMWNYFSVVRQLNDTLEMLSMTEPQNPPGPQPFKNFSPEVKFMMRFFVVTCDKEGQITEMDHDNIASVSEEDAESFVKVALNKGKDRGFYKGYRYLLTEKEEDDTIIFLNAERELQNMKTPLTSILASADILDMEQEDNGRISLLVQKSSGRVKGTGIGLSIAKATAEAHGGSIKASYQKYGILFRVVL